MEVRKSISASKKFERNLPALSSRKEKIIEVASKDRILRKTSLHSTLPHTMNYETLYNNMHKGNAGKDQHPTELKLLVQKIRELDDNPNRVLRELVMKELIIEMQRSDPLFTRLNRNLAESLLLISKMQIYSEKERITRLPQEIGFILYGSVKIYTKDYKFQLGRGDSFGEHQLFGENIVVNARAKEESGVAWISRKHYTLLREESIKHGLKLEVDQLEVLLRLSFIKKRLRPIMDI